MENDLRWNLTAGERLVRFRRMTVLGGGSLCLFFLFYIIPSSTKWSVMDGGPTVSGIVGDVVSYEVALVLFLALLYFLAPLLFASGYHYWLSPRGVEISISRKTFTYRWEEFTQFSSSLDILYKGLDVPKNLKEASVTNVINIYRSTGGQIFYIELKKKPWWDRADYIRVRTEVDNAKLVESFFERYLPRSPHIKQLGILQYYH